VRAEGESVAAGCSSEIYVAAVLLREKLGLRQKVLEATAGYLGIDTR
jgi:hypothetical protein